MFLKRVHSSALIISGCVVLLFAKTTAAQPGRVTVQLVARGPHPPLTRMEGWNPQDVSLFGHVFMIVALHTASGPKQEVYGFYPRDGGTAMIKGPGMLR